MSLPISNRTRLATNKTLKQPNLVICFDGLETCYGSGVIKKLIRIGDPGLFIDGTWKIGGVDELENQLAALSMDASSTSIRAQLDPDKARGSSIQSMDIELVDIDGQITELITPGLIVEDMLGRKAKIYLAMDIDTAGWPEDYVLLFRGVVDSIKALPASIIFTISHPEAKKKQIIFPKFEGILDGAINNSTTTITLQTTSGLLEKVLGPDGLQDPAFEHYIRIDDELIQYASISGNQLLGCTRGALATIPASHDDEADVFSMYRLTDTAMDLAQKIMLSKQGPWVEDIPISSFNVLPGPVVLPNSIWFQGVDIKTEYGVSVGDYITTTGASNGANNVTLKEIISVVVADTGSYIEVDGVSFIDENPTSAVIDFRSKYDTLPSGLGMGADEVDVDQHEYLERLFLSSFDYDFYLKESIEDAREWLDQEIYKPASCYSVPRKARSSVQLHIGPIPGAEIQTFSKSNIIRPSRINLRRSINKNFFNTIVYRFEEDALEDKFLRGVITQDGTSLARIPIGSRALVVNAKGLREDLNGQNLAQSASNRRLNRYKYGAEHIEGLNVTFGEGFRTEVGDIVIFDPTDLFVANTAGGNREKAPALFEVVNKSLNYKIGEVVLDLIDTSFNGAARYGLIGPASKIQSGVSTTQFIIYQAFPSPFGSAEYQKWLRYPDCAVKVRSPDGTTRYAQTVIVSSSSNLIEVSPALPFTPQPDDIMELAQYDFASVTDQIKLIYAHMKDSAFGDGKPQYQML